MKVGFTNISAIVTTSRKPNKNNIPFEASFGKKSQELKKMMNDEDKRYSIFGALAGAAILLGLGVGLVNKNKVLKIFERNKKVLKHYLKPELSVKQQYFRAHGGPDIDLTKGKTAIHDAWTEYINGYTTKRKQNNQVHKYYKEVLNDPVNVAKLNEIEEKLWQKVIK